MMRKQPFPLKEIRSFLQVSAAVTLNYGPWMLTEKIKNKLLMVWVMMAALSFRRTENVWYSVPAGQKPKRKLKNIKTFLQKTWLHPPQWNYILVILTAAILNR